MKIEPWIDPAGVPRERERAAYQVMLISEGERFLICFLRPEGDGLTCLEFVRIFTIPLRPGTSADEARALADGLVEHAEGLDAVYAPPPRPKPTNPNVLELRAA